MWPFHPHFRLENQRERRSIPHPQGTGRSRRRTVSLGLEPLEDRCLLNAGPTPPPGNVFQQASAMYQQLAKDQFQVNANTGALMQTLSGAGMSTPGGTAQAAKQIADSSGNVVADLNGLNQELQQLVKQQIESLQSVLAQYTTETIRSANSQITALQAQLNSLPPDQRATVASAIAAQQLFLADGALVSLSQYADLVGGQLSAVVNFYSQFGPQLAITLVQADIDQTAATIVEDMFSGTETPSNGGGGTTTVFIAGTYVGDVNGASVQPANLEGEGPYHITLTINADGSGHVTLNPDQPGFSTDFTGQVQQNADGTVSLVANAPNGATVELTNARIINGNQLNGNFNIAEPNGSSIAFSAADGDTGAPKFVLTRQ